MLIFVKNVQSSCLVSGSNQLINCPHSPYIPTKDGLKRVTFSHDINVLLSSAVHVQMAVALQIDRDIIRS